MTIAPSAIIAQTPSDFAVSWDYPLKPWDDFTVKQDFGRATFQGKTDQYHPGIDVSSKSRDTKYLPVYAAADGVVSYLCNSSSQATDCQGFGKAVLVSHVLPQNRALQDGTTRVTSIYGHLQISDTMPIVTKGTQVKKGRTIIGYIADQAHCGDVCDGPHLHFGIRKGHFEDKDFPKNNWGYFSLSNSAEFSNWVKPTEFIQARMPVWWEVIRTPDFWLPLRYTFYVCDKRRIKAYFDDIELFHTSPEDSNDDSPLTSSAGINVWPPGKHEVKAEFFDLPNSTPVDLSWYLLIRPACASETETITPTFTPTSSPTSTPTGTPTLTPTRAATPSPTPTRTLTLSPLTRTQVFNYYPKRITGERQGDGCWRSIPLMSRTDAWRCTYPEGKYSMIVDPCFSIPGNNRAVVCPDETTSEFKSGDFKGYKLNLKEPLPANEFVSPYKVPWQIELENGAGCIMVQGTHYVPENYKGKEGELMECSDGSMILDVPVQGLIWTVRTGYYTPDGSAIVSGRVKIRTIWQ